MRALASGPPTITISPDSSKNEMATVRMATMTSAVTPTGAVTKAMMSVLLTAALPLRRTSRALIHAITGSSRAN